MTDDHAPFLQAIAAQPGNAAPRLIYADWLEEQGDTARAKAWQWLVKENRLPGQVKHLGGRFTVSGRPKKNIQRFEMGRAYCWVGAWDDQPRFVKQVLDLFRLKESCLLPQHVFARLHEHHGAKGWDFAVNVLGFATALEAEQAAIEAMAELIREDAQATLT